MTTRLRLFFAVLLVPLVLFAPIVLTGRLFLPLLPGGLQPLAVEDSERAAEAFEDASYAQSDRLFPVLTDQLAMRDELRAGSLPTWEPNLGLGYPLLGGSIAALFYPPNLVAILTDPARAAGPVAALSLLLAGLGAFLFFRRLGLGAGVALVGMLAYQLGGFGLGNLFYGMKVDAALWLPWLLWALEGIRLRQRGSALALGIAVALSLLAGFVTIAAFSLVLAGVWALVRLLGSRGAPSDEVTTNIPRLIVAGFAVAAGVALASVGTLPFLATSFESVRTERSPDDLVVDSLPYSAPALLGLVVRDFVDTPTSNAQSGTQPVAWWITPEAQLAKADGRANPLEWNLYAGAAVVLLALLGLLCNTKRALAPALMLVATIGFAQGWPVLRPLLYVPGLNFGSPSRILGVTWFLWPWLAVLGVQALAERRARQVFALVASAAVVGLALFAWWATPETLSQHITSSVVSNYGPKHGIDAQAFIQRIGGSDVLLEASTRVQFGVLGALASVLALILALAASTQVRDARRAWILGALAVAVALAPLALATPIAIAGIPMAGVLAAGVLGLLALAWSITSREPRIGWLPIALVILIEGLFGASGNVTARRAPAGELFPTDSPALNAVAETAGSGRVLRFDPTGVSHVEGLARPNFLQPYGVGDLCAWIVFTPHHLVELAGAIDPRPQFDMRFRSGIAALRNPAHVDHPLFDAWNITCILSRDPLEHPCLTETFAQNGFHVYRRSGALGTAWIVGTTVIAQSDSVARQVLATRSVDPRSAVVLSQGTDPGPQVEITTNPLINVERPSKRRLDIQIDESPGGWLVLAEQWAPGWRAIVNGVEAPIERANYTQRAVRVPAGSVTVEMLYSPPALELAVLLGIGGLLALLFVETRFLRKRNHRAHSASR